MDVNPLVVVVLAIVVEFIVGDVNKLLNDIVELKVEKLAVDMIMDEFVIVVKLMLVVIPVTFHDDVVLVFIIVTFVGIIDHVVLVHLVVMLPV